MKTWNRLAPIGLFAVLSMFQPVHAGSIDNLQLFDGTNHSPVVTVHYSTADGEHSLSASTYADPMVSDGTVAPIYYCVDLWHENTIGSSYTITPVSGISYPTSTYDDVDNRIAWLLSQNPATADARGAVQLAIWYVTDNARTKDFKGFSFSGGDSTLTKDYHELLKFQGYDKSTTYQAQFWAATHDPSGRYNQDLVSEQKSINPQSVPEPGTGMLGLVGVAWVVVVRRWCRHRRRHGDRG